MAEPEQIVGVRPADETVFGAFAAAVALRPGSPAVVDRTGVTTYAELHDRACSVTSALTGPGLSPRGPVLVLGDHGAATVAAMLGCARAGLPYLVLDRRAPLPYLTALVERHGARAVVADDRHASIACAVAPDEPLVDLDALIHVDDGAPASSAGAVDPGDPVSVSYTSGSSGTPKAVVHAHASVVRNARRYAGSIDAGPGDCFLVASPLSAVAASTPLYAALLSGGAVCLHELQDGGTERLADVVTEAGVTVVHLTPAALPSLPSAPVGGLVAVRLVALGGDRFVDEHLAVARSWFPLADVLHRYSTSETNQIAGYRIGPADAVPVGVVGVGRPVPWVRVRIVADDGTPVVDGRPGEVEVGSDGLALGYLDDPELTTARFVSTDVGRVYRTGDRGRLLPDGSLELLGRADEVVKVRGVLVDLAAVERALVGAAGVTEAAVVATGRPTSLTAFVVGADRSTAVRAAVADRLPAAMVPARIALVDALPLTTRGKVDRTALAERADTIVRPAYVEPQDPVERFVADAAGSVLARTDIGRDDDVFALGADSLAAEELCSRLSERLGRRVDVATLLAYPTPASLAAWAATEPSGPAAQADARLVRLADGPADRPAALLFSGGSGAHVDGLAMLARALAPRRCYAVLPRAFAARGRPDRTIDAMAASAVAAVRDLPPGPLVVLGHSAGGTVAAEAARQLVAAGVEVPALVLLDARAITPALAAHRRLLPDLRDALRINRQVRAERGQRSSWLRRAYWVPRYLLRRARRRVLAATAGWAPRIGAAQHRAFEAVLKIAVRRWLDGPCPVPVVVVRAQEGPFARSTSADLGWGQVAGVMDVSWVPGGHDTITSRRFAASTARAVDAALAELGVG